MVSGSRSTALDLLNQVTFDDAYANLAMPKILKISNLNQRDKTFSQELAFGTLRHQLTYDAIIDEVSTRKSMEMDAKLLNCLRLGCHQILQMRVPDHAAISETVELVRKNCGEKVVGFANGVLRSISRKSLTEWLSTLQSKTDAESFRAFLYSHPQWIVSAYRTALEVDGLASDLDQLLDINNTPAAVNLVALPGLAQRPDETETLKWNRHSPYGFSISGGNPTELTGFGSGLIRVQDEGSQLAALALCEYRDPKSGEDWLDMCAGPGGKSAILASISRSNNVNFEANEPIAHRAGLVSSALEPIWKFRVRQRDGREYGKVDANKYDRILVDAPCTGLGALRRRPEARWRKRDKDLKELCKLQFELLESAIASIKPGGLCLYVTCSPHVSETTAIIHKAMQNLDVEVLDLTEFMNSRYFQGKLPSNRKTVQLFTHRDGTDSMFLALLTKPSRQ
jgi:16S rRNA (cytosine967-C5)-methyltransferase